MNKLSAKSGCLVVGNTKVPYVLSRSAKRKRTVALCIGPELNLSIMAPQITKLSRIEEIVQRHIPWIVRRLADIKYVKNQIQQREYVDGETVTYLGQQYRLKITRNKNSRPQCNLRIRHFEVNIPFDWVSGHSLGQEVRFEVMRWLKKQACEKLAARVQYWSKKTSIKPNRIIIANPTKRWGSCDSRNNIRLNWRIVMAPISIIDYVILHELCHISHKNHSRLFWNLIGNFMPDYDIRRNELRKHGADYQLV